MKEHNEENKDLNPNEVDATTDNGNSQNESNDAMAVIDTMFDRMEESWKRSRDRIAAELEELTPEQCGNVLQFMNSALEFATKIISSKIGQTTRTIELLNIQHLADNTDIPTPYFLSAVFNNGTADDVLKLYNQHKLIGITPECSEGE